jgi:hypothetical protein
MGKVTARKIGVGGGSRILISGLPEIAVDLLRVVADYEAEDYDNHTKALMALEKNFVVDNLTEEMVQDIQDGYLLEVRDDGTVVYEIV